MNSLGDVLTVAAAGIGAGFVNGAAGGGSLVSYPLLLTTGLPALTANVTNTVGLLTGYAGGALGFRDHLRSQRTRLRELTPVALAGGIAGAVLLLVTSEAAFESIVPVLILGACLLFGFQPIVRRRVVEQRQRHAVEPHDRTGSRHAALRERSADQVASLLVGDRVDARLAAGERLDDRCRRGPIQSAPVRAAPRRS